MLEIGPGSERIEGFETLSAAAGPGIDYRHEAHEAMPFDDGTFSVIYASHVLEHIPWYQVEAALTEWHRILRVGGVVEVLVPDASKIGLCLSGALSSEDVLRHDPWFRFNDQKTAWNWINGRVFSYGDGTGRRESVNWHRSLFRPQDLEDLLKRAGFSVVERLDEGYARGYDHGWISLGFRGTKQ